MHKKCSVQSQAYAIIQELNMNLEKNLVKIVDSRSNWPTYDFFYDKLISSPSMTNMPT